MYDCGFLERSRHPYVRRDRHYRGRHNLIARLAGNRRRPQPSPERPHGHRAHASQPLARQPVLGRGPRRPALRAGKLGHEERPRRPVRAWPWRSRKAGVRLHGDLLCESVIDEEFGGGGGHAGGPPARRQRRRLRDRGGHEPRGGPRDPRRARLRRGLPRPATPWPTSRKAEVVSPAIPLGRAARMGRRLGQAAQDGGARRDLCAIPRPGAGAGARRRVEPLRSRRGLERAPGGARPRVLPVPAPRGRAGGHARDRGVASRASPRRTPSSGCTPLARRAAASIPRSWATSSPADHPWTRCLHGAAREHPRRAKRRLSASEWPCDAFLAQRYFEIPTLLFGPRARAATTPTSTWRCRRSCARPRSTWPRRSSGAASRAHGLSTAQAPASSERHSWPYVL